MPCGITKYLTCDEARQLEAVCAALTADAIADHQPKLANEPLDLVGFIIADEAEGVVATEPEDGPASIVALVCDGLDAARVMLVASQMSSSPADTLRFLDASAVCLILSFSTAHESGLAVYTEHVTDVMTHEGRSRFRSRCRLQIRPADVTGVQDYRSGYDHEGFREAAIH